MIEKRVNYTNSTVKEMTDFIEIRVENLESREEKNSLLLLPRKEREER